MHSTPGGGAMITASRYGTDVVIPAVAGAMQSTSGAGAANTACAVAVYSTAGPNAAVTAGAGAMYFTIGVDAATRVGDGATGAGAAVPPVAPCCEARDDCHAQK